MTEKEFEERIQFKIPEKLKQALRNDQDIFLAGAHINQWEWGAIAAGQRFSNRVVGIYKPLSSKPMDHLMREMREKLGTEMIPMKRVVRDIMKKKSDKTIYLFLTDQSTPFVDKAHWVNFFRLSTPFTPGMAFLAQKRNIPIFYFYIKRLKRGYYEAHFELLTEFSKNHSAEEITQLYSQKVEENILTDPPAWLWTHKRWKRVLQY